MTTLDIILLVLFIPGIIVGLKKGFVRMAISLAVIFLGAWMSFKFSIPFSENFIRKFSNLNPEVANIISFVMIFIVVGLVLNLLGILLTKIIKMATLGWVNRALGIVAGIFETALILGLIIWAFDGLNAKWGLVKTEILSGSDIYCYIKDFANRFFPYLKELIGK